MCELSVFGDDYNLKAPTGILLGATAHESASSSLRFTCTKIG